MDTDPLTSEEEELWRALNRLLIALPRALDDDLKRATGLSLNEYATLMFLSETDGQELRMTDLAAATALSASRMSRMVESLRGFGLVEKVPSSDDGRGSIARLTPAGLQRLKDAYPYHLASARARVMNHLDKQSVRKMARSFGRVVEELP